MREIFDQMDNHLPLPEQLSILYKNLHPDYIRDIFRSQFNSYQELMENGKQIENRLEILRKNRPFQPNIPKNEKTASIEVKPNNNNNNKGKNQNDNDQKKNNSNNNKKQGNNDKKNY